MSAIANGPKTGRRKPNSTSVVFLARSPPHIARTCGTVWWLSSIMQIKSLGK